MSSFPFPRPVAVVPFAPDAGPTFTQIWDDTMGNLGTDADGFPAAFAELQALSNAFGVELTADQGLGPIAILGGVPGILDPGALDTTISNYVATIPTGEGILTDAGAIQEPLLLTLPITPGDGSTAFIPPSQVTQDFGTAKLNSAAVQVQYGRFVETQTSGDVGDSSKGFVVQAAPFSEWFNYKDNAAGTQTTVTFGITMTPNTVGQWTAQFEYIQSANKQLVIVTLKVNVIP